MKAYFIFFLIILLNFNIYSIDEIRLVGGQSEEDQRHIYPHVILEAALEATIDNYGPYTIIYTGLNLTRNRALIELEKGEKINIHEAPTRDEWEETVLPVRIPIRKGLLGYRLFLINKQDARKFRNLRSIDQLKRLKAGLGSQWSTTVVMNELDFSIETSNEYEGLFMMLRIHRFDYFPRGINEIFNEYNTRKDHFPDMIIEESKALYFTTPTYLFVSPEYPRLAERIEQGLLRIIENGIFETIFLEYFSNFIEMADLENREIFYVNNPLLSDETPLDKKNFGILLKLQAIAMLT